MAVKIAALPPFGAVLAGRVFGPVLTAAPAGAAALAAAGACQLAALGYATARPPAADPAQVLASWLTAHHLTCGLGTFSEDNITPLDSGGAVRMLTVSWLPPARPVQPLADPGHRRPLPAVAVPRLYQSSASWYDPRSCDANFVVTGSANGTADLIPGGEILALGGPPSRLPGDIGHP